jgi:hypothetical protein
VRYHNKVNPTSTQQRTHSSRDPELGWHDDRFDHARPDGELCRAPGHQCCLGWKSETWKDLHTPRRLQHRPFTRCGSPGRALPAGELVRRYNRRRFPARALRVLAGSRLPVGMVPACRSTSPDGPCRTAWAQSVSISTRSRSISRPRICRYGAQRYVASPRAQGIRVPTGRARW